MQKGGLDCRYLISELRPTKFKIVSVTTVSTPHRGSPFADYLIDNIVGRMSAVPLTTITETRSCYPDIQYRISLDGKC